MRLWLGITLLAALSVTFGASQAQPKPKPKPKTPAQKQPAQKTAPSRGTVQMPGDNGKLNVTYQIGPRDAEYHLTLESAEVALRFPTVEDSVVAMENQRLLVLTWSVQNPRNRDQGVDWADVRFTVVSPSDENFEWSSYIYNPEKRSRVSTTLKPAQKMRLISATPIFETGPISKLIAMRHQPPVVRYDLRDVVKPLKSAWVDSDGVSAKKQMDAKFGQTIDWGPFDVVVEKIEAVEEAGVYKSDDENQVWTVTASFKNQMMKPQSLSWNLFTPVLRSEDGEEIDWASDLITMSSGRTVSGEIDPDDSQRARFIFRGPKSLKPSQLRLTDNSWGKRTARFKME